MLTACACESTQYVASLEETVIGGKFSVVGKRRG